LFFFYGIFWLGFSLLRLWYEILIYVLTKTTTVFILKIIEMLFTLYFDVCRFLPLIWRWFLLSIIFHFPTLQIAIGTDDVYKTAEAIKLSTGKLTREPGPLPGINTKITACLDPDGWKTVCPLNLMIWIFNDQSPKG
jgi:hypothetical protein